MHALILIALILLSSLTTSAQSISVFDIDTSGFPVMKAKFYAFDASGEQVRPTIGEMGVSEDGQQRTVISVTCPPPQTAAPVSLALSIDISGSMRQSDAGEAPIDLTKTTISELLPLISHTASEFALQTCDARAQIVQDFTRDKGLITSALPFIQARDGNDFVEQLLNPMTGLLAVAAKGRQRKIAVMFTDAWWSSLDPYHLRQCIDLCRQHNIQFHAVIYSPLHAEPNGIKSSLRELAAATGGVIFDGVTTRETARTLAAQLKLLQQKSDPCEITWNSLGSCMGEARAVLIDWNGRQAQANYNMPPGTVSALQFSPSSLSIQSKPIGLRFDTTMTVTSPMLPFTVTRITSSNPAYDINPKSFTLAAGASRTLTISYTPTDSSFSWTRFDIQGDLCTGTLHASAWYPGIRPTTSTLEVVHPNGGEMLVVGSDTVIQWKGIPPDDTVRLEYSTDNGSTWLMVAERTAGGSDPWHVPNTPSQRCLVRVKQLPPAGGDATKTLSDHTGAVYKVAWSGTRVATISDDNTAMIWNANTGALMQTLVGHTSTIYDIVWNGNRVATASDDNTAAIWDATSGARLRKLSGHTAPVYAIAWNGNRIVTAGGDNTANIWNATSGMMLHSLAGHSDAVRHVAFSRDGSRVATAGDDNTARIWDANSGALLRTLTGHTEDVHSVTWSSDGSRLATASGDKTVRIWNTSNGALLQTLSGHASAVYHAVWSSDGRRIATAGTDHTARVWDAGNGGLILTLTGHVWEVRSIAWSPDGSRLATASYDRTARIWDANSGALLQTLTGHGEWIRSIAWSPDGSHVATASDDRTAKIWEVDPYVQSDVSDALFSIVTPSPASQDVEMGRVAVGTAKDSLVQTFISNTGTYPFTTHDIQITGVDASDFSIVSGIPPFDVPAGESHGVEFRFLPTSTGSRSAELLIITQTDTLRQNIRGEGVAPVLEVVADVIDFGQVDVGSRRDTLRAVTVKNVGTTPLDITATRHAGPNNRDYTTLAGGGSFTLQPEETALLDLRFAPSAPGRTSGRLLFEHDGVGSPATMQLFGEGILPPAQIQGMGITFAPFICENERVDTVQIQNVGGRDLDISAAAITGTNAGDFTMVQPFTPMTIPPDSARSLVVRFTPQATGDRSALLELHSNSLNDSLLVLPLSGRRDAVDFTVSMATIGLGVLCPDESLDTMLVLTNTGTIDGTIDATATGVTLAQSRFRLGVAATEQVAIRFAGRSSEGAIDETITFTDSICGSQQVVRLTGSVEMPKLSAANVMLVGTAGGAAVEELMTVQNSGGRNATIMNEPDISPFEFVGVSFPLTISAGSSLQLRVRYTAVDTATRQVSLALTGHPCGIATSATITGRGLNTAAMAAIGALDVSAYPGDEVSLAIVLDKSTNLQTSSATSLSATLRFNATLLDPIGSTPRGTISGSERIIPLELPTTPQSGNVLTTLRFRAMLGNDTATALTLENPAATGGSVSVQATSGMFRLLGVCYEGGARLLNPSGLVKIVAVRPNPIADEAEIEIETNEAGRTRVVVMDMLGREAAVVYDGELSSGRHLLPLSTFTLTTGSYYVMLVTPTVRCGLPLNVVR